MKRNDITNSAQLFYYKATIDLNAARYMYNGFMHENLEIDLEKICFDLQQCVEKLIKSVLSHNSIRFPRTHELELLLDMINGAHLILHTDVKSLIPLSDYAVEGRYAVIHDDLHDIEKYLLLVEQLREEVQKIVL